MRVMIAGGGTGGHVYPGLAIHKALKDLVGELDVIFIGARGGVERNIFAEKSVPHLLLPGRGVRGSSLSERLKAPWWFLAALVMAVKEIFRFKPDVVVGTGGFASAAAVLAAGICRKPRVIQEQNSVPGMVNRILSRCSHLVLLTYEESRRYLPSRVICAVVGNPLRFHPGGEKDRRGGVEFLGIRGDVPVILIMGGSRGARSLNRYGVEAAKMILRQQAVQFVILAGQRDFNDVVQDVGEENDLIRVLPFVEEMEKIYGAADLAVSRAGASSVCELAAYGVPAIFVPYPYAADDHQKKNVEELGRMGAAVVLDDENLSGELLANSMVTLLGDGEKRSEMSAKLREWAKCDAAGKAAEMITALVKKNAIIAAERRSANGSRTRQPRHSCIADTANGVFAATRISAQEERSGSSVDCLWSI